MLDVTEGEEKDLPEHSHTASEKHRTSEINVPALGKWRTHIHHILALPCLDTAQTHLHVHKMCTRMFITALFVKVKK